MSTIIQSIENEQLQRRPRFAAGDRVRVHFQVIEGSRTRTQVFEGVVIKRQGSGARETFTVRKQSFGVGVERTFPVHSPKIEQLEVAGRGNVRRAKLYYLRDRVGKAARIAERRWGIGEEDLGSSEDGATDAEGATQSEAPQAVPTASEDGEEGAVVEVEGDAGDSGAEGGEGAADAGAEPEGAGGETDADASGGPDASGEADAGTGGEPADADSGSGEGATGPEAEGEAEAAAGSGDGKGSSGQGD